MGKTQRTVTNIARTRLITGVVLESAGGYATIRTTRGSGLLRQVKIYGGAIPAGTTVQVQWDGNSPYVASGETYESSQIAAGSRIYVGGGESNDDDLGDIFLTNGWDIDSNGVLWNQGISIDPAGVIKVGLNDDTVGLTSADATYRMWAGTTTPSASSPFSVDKDGKLHSVDGDIGGWTINTNYLAKDTGTDNTSAGMAPLDYPFYAGRTYANRATAPFRVTPNGALWSTNGTIGGWNINATNIAKGTDIIIDSAGPFIKGGNYIAGQQGFYIAGDYAEFGNARIRGTLNMAVFEANYIQATAGDFGVFRSAGKLTANITLGAVGSTGTINLEDSPAGTALYAANSILRFKDPPSIDAWIRIDTVGSPSGNGRNYDFTVRYNGSVSLIAGMTCVDYGPSGYGFLLMSASDLTTSPWFALYKHAGSPWTTVTMLGKIGKFVSEYGFTGYGFAFGDYANNKYIRYDGTDLIVKGAITALSGAIEGTLTLGANGKIVGGSDFILRQDGLLFLGADEYNSIGWIATENDWISPSNPMVLIRSSNTFGFFRGRDTSGNAYADHYVDATNTKAGIRTTHGGDLYIRDLGLNTELVCNVVSATFNTDLTIGSGGNLVVGGSATITGGTLTLGSDTSIFRQTTDTLRTNDNLEIYGKTLKLFSSGGVQSGEIYADGTWLRFNQNVNYPLYTPQRLRADGGIASGALTPDDGKIAANVRFQRGGLDVYTYVQYTHTYTSVFNQAVAATTDYTIDLSSYLPAGTMLAHVRLLYEADSITGGGTGESVELREYGQSAGNGQLASRTQIANLWSEAQGFCSVDSSGRRVVARASVAGTVQVRLLGYLT